MGMNECFFAGNLARDMELRHTARGLAVGEFTLCVDTNRKNDRGEWESSPNYFRCKILGARADALAPKMVRGAKAVVRATARWEEWTDSETGRQREAVRFVVNDVVSVIAPKAYSASPAADAAADGREVITGDDIPF